MKHNRQGAPGNPPRYSLVIPIFNEEKVLPLLIRRIKALLDQLDGPSEAIFVDDGSSDTSAIYLREMATIDPRLRLIELSRNFGHQIAITAGMDAAAGDAVIVMDADLQDPPEVALDLIAKWKEGYEIVYARRIKRDGETLFKRLTAKLFYRTLDSLTSVSIPRDVGDFRLIGRKALTTFKSMPERDRFVRGMFGWMGFKQTEVAFERAARAAGESKYPFWKMMRLAMHGIVSFSDKPLRAALWAGMAISGIAALLGVFAVFAWAFDMGVVQGWTSTVVIVSFLSGINLFMTGVIGLYVGGIHAEVKRRPLYVVDRLTGFDEAIKAQAQSRGGPGLPGGHDRRFG
jgi:polyisoprenyl-phosphate glycosyltransferase